VALRRSNSKALGWGLQCAANHFLLSSSEALDSEEKLGQLSKDVEATAAASAAAAAAAAAAAGTAAADSEVAALAAATGDSGEVAAALSEISASGIRLSPGFRIFGPRPGVYATHALSCAELDGFSCAQLTATTKTGNPVGVVYLS
jgi:hypothetical protein